MDSRLHDIEHADRAAGEPPKGGRVCPPVPLTLASARGDLPDAHGSWEVRGGGGWISHRVVVVVGGGGVVCC